jgi:hypothetical protein
MTNNKQQTTVDWIEQEMLKGNLSLKEILIQAKEMEKERIEEDYMSGYSNGGLDTCITAKQYYNETYGGGNK